MKAAVITTGPGVSIDTATATRSSRTVLAGPRSRLALPWAGAARPCAGDSSGTQVPVGIGAWRGSPRLTRKLDRRPHADTQGRVSDGASWSARPMMEVDDSRIEVASRLEAGEILSSPHRCAEVTCLVSIGEPHDQ